MRQKDTWLIRATIQFDEAQKPLRPHITDGCPLEVSLSDRKSR
jgi:hypothetical protein